MIYDINELGAYEYARRVREISAGHVGSFYVITFGCQQNEADSEKIRGLCQMMGYREAESPDVADMVILNTCAIREHAEMKALSMLGRFKDKRRENPSYILGVVGCMAAEPHIKDLIKNDFHYVTFTLEPNMLHRIPEAVFSFLSGRRRSFVLGEDAGDIVEGITPSRKSRQRAWVSIMYGCNNFCSYCIVPYVRGRERSRSSAEIIRECRELVDGGCREITLLGQNVNSYSSDMDFPELLEKIANIPGDFRVKFMTSHPKDASDRLISVMARYSPKVMPYFHLPLQSGSDRILGLMNRTYDSERFLDIVGKLREMPDICLSTDIIVGFPTETEEDFKDTLAVMREARFDSAYAFKYSPRRGTVAAQMDGQVPREVADRRLSELLSLEERISLDESRKYLGRELRVLVDAESRRGDIPTVSARTDNNRPVHFAAGNDKIGEFCRVRITEAGAYDLLAEEI